ncbi:hypothetical protein A2U01_0079129, partial [Trifolium medium]|nr:hypothetical protein [Trifolium medium]
VLVVLQSWCSAGSAPLALECACVFCCEGGLGLVFFGLVFLFAWLSCGAPVLGLEP